MQTNLTIKDLLHQILTIINYTDDKNVFINKFIDLSKQQSLLELIQSLPIYKQENIKQQTQPDKTQILVHKYFTLEEINKAMSQTLQANLKNYLNTIKPSLSEEQIKTLNTSITSFSFNI